MKNKKEMTALGSPVDADEKQSLQICTNNSISNDNENIKNFEEMQRESY